MVETEKKTIEGRDADILFSKTVKAGQRIYYIDVKQNRRGEKYLSITESKKMMNGTPEDPHFSYEKHKIFLFREDFSKFGEALQEAIGFINENEESEPRERQEEGNAIKLDLEF